MHAIWKVPFVAKFLVALATFLFVLTALSVGAILGTQRARLAFVEESAIRVSSLFPDEPVIARAMEIYTAVGGRSISVMAAEPLQDNVEPPFLLENWPDRGQFLVSPDLAVNVGELSARFGDFAGFLPGEGLPSSYSRMVLVRPTVPLTEDANAAGFGLSGQLAQTATRSPEYFPSDRLPTFYQWAFPIGGLLVSGVFSMAAIGNLKRANRKLMREFELIGIRPRKIGNKFYRSISPAILAGAAAAWILLLISALADVPIPGAQFTIRALDVRRSLSSYAILGALGTLLALAFIRICSSPDRIPEFSISRSRAGGWYRSGWPAAFGILAVLLLAQMTISTARTWAATGIDQGTPLWLMIGNLVAALVAPIVVAFALKLVGQGLASIGRKLCSATVLVTGRLIKDSKEARQLASIGSVLIILAGFATTLTLVGSTQAINARRSIDIVDNKYIEVSIPPERSLAAENFFAQIHEQYNFIEISSEFATTPDGRISINHEIIGDQQALALWNLPSNTSIAETQMPAALAIMIPADVTDEINVIEVDSLSAKSVDEAQHLLVFRRDGAPVDRNNIQRIVSNTLGIDAQVGFGGETWLTGANDQAHSFRWFGWFGVVAGAVLIGATYMRASANQGKQIMTILPIDAMYSRTPIMAKVLALQIVLISCISILVGGVPSALFGRVTAEDLSTVTSSATIIAALCLMVLLVFLLSSVPQLFGINNLQRNWMPTGERQDG